MNLRLEVPLPLTDWYFVQGTKSQTIEGTHVVMLVGISYAVRNQKNVIRVTKERLDEVFFG